MLIWTTRFSRKKAVFAVLLMGAVMALLIVLVGRLPQENGSQDQPQLTCNEERVAYLESWGWQVEPEPVETLQFLLPAPLDESCRAYNDLQLTQGFDLTAYRGKQLSRYTYTVTNYPGRADGVQANLYLCEDLPVAGDILCPGTDGFQDTLVFPAQDDS